MIIRCQRRPVSSYKHGKKLSWHFSASTSSGGRALHIAHSFSFHLFLAWCFYFTWIPCLVNLDPSRIQALIMLLRAFTSLFLLTGLVSGAPLEARDVETASTASSKGKGSWTSIAPIALHPRQEHGAVAFDSNTIYIIGGIYEQQPDGSFPTVTTVQKYTISTNKWSTVASLPMPLNHPNSAVVNGKIYVMGGLTTTADPTFWQATGSCFMYDPSSNKWTTVATMPKGREIGSASVGVRGTTIYLAGGLSNTSLTPADEEGTVGIFTSFCTQTKKFTTLPNMPAGRDHAGVGLIDNNLYVLGGRYGGHNNTKNTVYRYNINSNCWDTGLAKLPTATGGCASGVIGNQIFLFGGEGYQKTADGLFPGTQAYDVKKNSWSSYANMDVPRHGTAGAAIGNRIYIPGGGLHMGGLPTNYSSYLKL